MLMLLLPVLGIFPAVSFVTYLRSSQLLPMALFGLLGYLVPVLLVVISVLAFRETIAPPELLTYIPIGLSVLVTGAYLARAAGISLSKIGG